MPNTYVCLTLITGHLFKVPEGVSDDAAVLTSDAFPAGFMAADMCSIEPGDTVVVWGAGGVGQMAIQSAWLLGAGRVIAIDRFTNRLAKARQYAKAETLNYEEVDILEALKEMTGGRGPDRCIDAVGMEAHTTGVEQYYDKALTLRMGQMFAQKYIPQLLDRVASGEADPSYVLTHKWGLDQSPEGY